MRVAFLVALCACNQAYDLDATVPGTKSVCPPINETPQFRPGLLQHMARDCDAYSFRGKTAVASCVRDNTPVIEVGHIDRELDLAPGLPTSAVTRRIARLSPDEMRLYVEERINTTFKITLYRRQADASWLLDPTIELAPDERIYRELSTVASDGVRDRIATVDAADNGVAEYAVDQTWNLIRTMTPNDLGVDEVRGFTMTSDGLRATFQGSSRDTGFTQFHQFYTDRRSVDEPFRPGDILENVPYNRHAFLTDDCGRIYMSGVGSIFFARR